MNFQFTACSTPQMYQTFVKIQCEVKVGKINKKLTLFDI